MSSHFLSLTNISSKPRSSAALHLDVDAPSLFHQLGIVIFAGLYGFQPAGRDAIERGDFANVFLDQERALAAEQQLPRFHYLKIGELELAPLELRIQRLDVPVKLLGGKRTEVDIRPVIRDADDFRVQRSGFLLRHDSFPEKLPLPGTFRVHSIGSSRDGGSPVLSTRSGPSFVSVHRYFS